MRKPSVEVYAQYIDAAAAEFGIDRALIAAIIYVESGGDQNACSSSGAMGLMQLMPATCEDFSVSSPYDPEANIEGGSALLARNLKRYSGDVKKAVAAYNIGPRHVDDGTWMNYGAAIRYVQKVLAVYEGPVKMNPSPNPQPSAPPVTAPLPIPPITPGLNYTDVMTSAIIATQAAVGQPALPENGALGNAADRMLEDLSAGKLAQADLADRVGAYASAAGFDGAVRAVLVSTKDDGFAAAWTDTSSEPGSVVGLRHQVVPGAHLWLVLIGHKV